MALIRLVAIGVLATAVGASTAAAQGVRSPRLTASFGIGRVNPLPIEQPYTAPVWSAAVEIAVAKHLIVEVVAGGWGHTTSDATDFESNDPRRPVSVMHSTTDIREEKTSIGLNAVARTSVGRVQFSSGAGAGFAFFSHRITDIVTTCVASNPRFCPSSSDIRFSAVPFSMQAVLGIDVAVTSRLRAFLAYRQSQPFTMALGDVGVLTGLKVALH